MGQKILFIHSAGSQGDNQGSDGLVTNLKLALGESYSLLCPKMPDPENPNYQAWKGTLGTQLDLIDDQIILIGHSLGGSVLLKYFSEIPYQKRILGMFIIASPFFMGRPGGLAQFSLRKDFGSRLVSIPRIYLYHSQDDEWVPFDHQSRFAENLPQSVTRNFTDYGHSFDRPFPELIHDITSIGTSKVSR